MTPAQKILEMIENVDPADSATMDEIDALVFEYIKNKGRIYGYQTEPEYKVLYTGLKPYTRSRDALKAIRPEGVRPDFRSTQTARTKIIKYRYSFLWFRFGKRHKVCSPYLSEENLSELHAIIQAIEWERSQ